VSAFFQQNHARCLVLNGVLVRSIAHEICTMIAMTGTSSGTKPDWPAILASEQVSRYTLPHLVVSGPSFPGDMGVAVARTGTNGQLEALLSGDAVRWADAAVQPPLRPSEDIVDRYLSRRAEASQSAARSALAADLRAEYAAAHDKARALKELRYVMDFTGGAALDDQAAVAVDALSGGMSRCVTLSYPGGGLFGWDTHANNDPDQSALFEGLFQGLGNLMERLDAAPGQTAPTLAEETIVVVMSEMGRTPRLNQVNGKDHWPYTSVLLIGAGLEGDRVVGALDTNYYGLPVDPASGDVAEDAQVLSAEAVGATLLALADVDPGDHVSGVDPLTAVIR
jgi:hypothetical protein